MRTSKSADGGFFFVDERVGTTKEVVEGRVVGAKIT